MSILVIGEHNNKELKSSTLNSITAASVINDDIHVVVIGNNCEEMANRVATTDKVKKVLLLEDSKYENPIAEKISPVITSLAKDYSHIVSPATTFGKNIMPRVAALLDLSQVSDVIKIENEDTFVRPVYAGNALATVQSTDDKKIITIRPTSFDPAATEGGQATVEKISFDGDESKVEFIGREESKYERPELGTARIVVSGGRGVQSAENFKMIYEVADKLNADRKSVV